jgi:membrane-bound serine protease (ClpP class)
VGEAFAPSFGALGIGGIIAFVVGSIILMDTESPGFEVSRVLIGGVATAGGILTLVTATYFARSRRRPVVTGVEQLLHESAIAIADFDEAGPVRLRGEIWHAVTAVPVKQGQRLRVQRVNGLKLDVVPEP